MATISASANFTDTPTFSVGLIKKTTNIGLLVSQISTSGVVGLYHYVGSSVRITLSSFGADGFASEPTGWNPRIETIDPNGLKATKTLSDMTKVDYGIYYVDIDVEVAGAWRSVAMTDGSLKDVNEVPFWVNPL